MTETTETKERLKPGPVKGEDTRAVNVMLPPDLAAWGKSQPGGLSELIRRLLTEERERKEGKREN